MPPRIHLSPRSLISIAPTTFPVVSTDSKQMLCSWCFFLSHAYNPHTTCYHTIDCALEFPPPPWFSATNIQQVGPFGTDSTVPWKN